jgi:hypothetical protein
MLLNMGRGDQVTICNPGDLPAIPALSYKILCDLCRKPFAELFDDLFLAFVTTGWASIDVRLGTQPLLAGVDVELRHGYGIPEKAVASKDG